MTEISRSALFGKLNPVAYRAIESATVFCKLRGNPYVELVHWIHQILQAQDSDLHRIIRHFEIDPSRLASDITQALDKLPRGATSGISEFLGIHFDEAIKQAWTYATLLYGEIQACGRATSSSVLAEDRRSAAKPSSCKSRLQFAKVRQVGRR